MVPVGERGRPGRACLDVWASKSPPTPPRSSHASLADACGLTGRPLPQKATQARQDVCGHVSRWARLFAQGPSSMKRPRDHAGLGKARHIQMAEFWIHDALERQHFDCQDRLGKLSDALTKLLHDTMRRRFGGSHTHPSMHGTATASALHSHGIVVACAPQQEPSPYPSGLRCSSSGEAFAECVCVNVSASVHLCQCILGSGQ